MSCVFAAESELTKDLCAEMIALAPTNPFYTSALIDMGRVGGGQPWVLTLRREGQLVSACPAFLQSYRLERALSIGSLPRLPDDSVFWRGVLGFCRRMHVSSLTVSSFASPCAKIPPLGGEIWRAVRYEYLLDLRPPGLWNRLSSNHKRSINRAGTAGLQVRWAVDAHACQEHARLVEASMERRKNRGEAVPEQLQAASVAVYTQHGAGALFQVIRESTVLSSALILLAEKGGYYHSAGTSAEGMACGASPFLVYQLATILRQQSREVLNLGTTPLSNPGLRRFKAGFGSEPVQLEAAAFFLGSRARHRFNTLARSLYRNSVGLFQHG